MEILNWITWLGWIFLFIWYIVCMIIQWNMSDKEKFLLNKYDIAPKRLKIVYLIWVIVFLIIAILSIVVLIGRR